MRMFAWLRIAGLYYASRRREVKLKWAVGKLQRQLKAESSELREMTHERDKLAGRIEVLDDQLAMFHAWRLQETQWLEAEAAIQSSRKMRAIEITDRRDENAGDIGRLL